jgi:hypothetical protein
MSCRPPPARVGSLERRLTFLAMLVIANVGGEIQCDSCMNDPGKTIFVIYGPYGECYCGKCLKRDFSKYCTEQTEGE